jgi:hypothetical protein
VSTVEQSTVAADVTGAPPPVPAPRGGLAVSYCVFVAGLFGVLLFLPSLGNGFAFDDVAVVAQDARIRSLAHIDQIFTTGYWRETEHALYRPLTTLSFAIDWSLAPGSSAWFHLTNALAHGIASALVVLVLASFFSPGAALLGGLVFAAHPVHVEAVANVVGRADVIASVFALGAVALWMTESRVPHWPTIRTAFVAALYALALLTKESAVMLPALLLLVDAARGELRPREAGEYLRRNAGAFSALAVVLAGFLALRLSVLGTLAPTRLDPSIEVTTTSLARVLTALGAWPEFLRLLLVPRTLLADYGPGVLAPASTLTARSALGALLVAGGVIGGVVALRRGHRRAALGLLWFPVAILPVSNLLFPIGVLVAERTLYLPSFALAVGVAGAATALSARGLANRVLVAGAAVVLALFAVRTIERIPEWRSTDSIMIALVRDRPDSFRGQWHLARLARMNNDTTAALQRYRQALMLWPHRQRLVIEAAAFAAQAGQVRMAYDLSRVAVQRWPGDVAGQRLLAGAALDLGDTITARHAIRAGLAIAPRDDVLRRMAAAVPDDSTLR